MLARTQPPQPSDSEALFDTLQQQYPPHPKYGYDHYSKWKRGAERTLYLLKNLEALRQPGRMVVEAGCGDGNLSYVLAQYPHHVTMTDLEDWRDEHVQDLPFIQADIGQALPLEDAYADAVVSYNSFEHFNHPDVAFEEIVRICKPGGFIHLSFGPLYASAWGLHAYSTFKMPFPQFLFSETLIESKIQELGIWDLGTRRDSLQPLNRWRLKEFRELWNRNDLEVISEEFEVYTTHLDLVTRFPEAFQGRGLTIDDLTTATIFVTLEKR